MEKEIFRWSTDRALSKWHFEGSGRLSIDGGGNFVVETYGEPAPSKTSTSWLRDVELPDNFIVEWTFKSDVVSSLMLLFNAVPLNCRSIFEDPRINAIYSDLNTKRTMTLHSVGFNRGTSGRKSVLRKFSGDVPDEVVGAKRGVSPWWDHHDRVTRISEHPEPYGAEGIGHWHDFKLIREANNMKFFADGVKVHDVDDVLQYPYSDTVLKNGKMAIRNFDGPSVDVFSEIAVKAI